LHDALYALNYVMDLFSCDDPHDVITTLLKEADSALQRVLDITRHQSEGFAEMKGQWTGNA
jgi:hypothetical protein